MTKSEPPVSVGVRIRQRRTELDLSLSDLAKAASVSKAYLSALENGSASKVSGEKLYAIADALGVNMTDLMGRKLISRPPTEIPAGLREFALEQDLPEADVLMLARIEFRGGQPKTKERWAHIYSAIRSTTWMDDNAPSE